MERNIVFWIIGIVVVAAVFFNLGDFTANVAREKEVEPLLTIREPDITVGSVLNINARNIQTSQEVKIFTEAGDYTGKRFFTRASRCERKSSGLYECNLQYSVPTSMSPGRYYVQAKAKRTGELTGNKALFAVR